ncbi:MAG: cytochrome d ubiquinol oxidase subunit II [Phototrophicaceae bacterium]
MELSELWFILIAVLFIGFFFLEGFDYGVGILLPFVAKNDRERRVVINTIGPVWDANEVWLITAGGAMFAAFPNWYATMFSGFYLALFLILVGLIIRGVAFEFRSKAENVNWRRTWDYAIFIGSLLPAILFGVAFANIVRGMAIDENMNYIGGFWELLNVYSLVGGLVTFSLFTLHGALFLEMKADPVIQDRVQGLTRVLWGVATVLTVVFVAFSFVDTDIFDEVNIVQVISLGLAVVGLLAAGYFIFSKRYPMAFLANSLAIVFVVVLLFSSLFPNVMPSSLNEAYNLTVYNASSTDYTLRIMSIVAVFFVPIVLIYQGWTYWVFRKRVLLDAHLEY